MAIQIQAPSNKIHKVVEPAPKEIIEQLAFAQTKLSNSNIPWRLRSSSYIRISCINLQKYCLIDRDYFLDSIGDLSYSKLLASLNAENAQWWNKCRISIINTIESRDRTINLLLQPLNDFHRLILNC